jgi:hypothetical protein
LFLELIDLLLETDQLLMESHDMLLDREWRLLPSRPRKGEKSGRRIRAVLA